MATRKELVAFILDKLGQPEHFSARPMFGEFCLYANGKPVALICDDQLYVKIVPASEELEDICEKGEPYPGAKPHYVIEEAHLTHLAWLPQTLIEIARSTPAKEPKPKRKTSKKKSDEEA